MNRIKRGKIEKKLHVSFLFFLYKSWFWQKTLAMVQSVIWDHQWRNYSSIAFHIELDHAYWEWDDFENLGSDFWAVLTAQFMGGILKYALSERSPLTWEIYRNSRIFVKKFIRIWFLDLNVYKFILLFSKSI